MFERSFDAVVSMQLQVAFLCWLISLVLRLFQMEAHRQRLLQLARAVPDETLSALAWDASVYEAVLLDGRDASTVIALAVRSMEQAAVLKRVGHPDLLTFCDAFGVGPGVGMALLDGLEKCILALVEAGGGRSMHEITRDLTRSPEFVEMERRTQALGRRLCIEVPFWESMPHSGSWRRFQGGLGWLAPRTLVTANRKRFLKHWNRWHGALPTAEPGFARWRQDATRYYSCI